MEFENMKKRRWFWLIFAVLVCAGILGYFFYEKQIKVQQMVNDAGIETEKVRRGELEIYASGSGTIIPAEEYQLGFGTEGTIGELNVEVGDEVQAGDVLATLAGQIQLTAQITEQNLTVIEKQKELDDVYDLYYYDKAQAIYAVAEATVNLDDAKEARSRLDYPRCTKETVEDLWETYYRAGLALEREKDTRADSYFRAKDSYNAAYIAWWECVEPRNQTYIASLDAEVVLAQALLDQAQREYDEIADGPTEVSIKMAELALAEAEAQLAVYEQQLGYTVITAPIDGTIMEVNARIGKTVGSILDGSNNYIITLDDLSVPTLEVFFDEVDFTLVTVGTPVEIVFDAMPNDVFSGEIVSVDQALVDQWDSSGVRAVIQMDMDTYMKPDSLSVGMSALVDAIHAKVENAILAPFSALQETDVEGEYVVYVLRGEIMELVPVEIGLTDYTYIEILSGLNVGDQVVTGGFENIDTLLLEE